MHGQKWHLQRLPDIPTYFREIEHGNKIMLFRITFSFFSAFAEQLTKFPPRARGAVISKLERASFMSNRYSCDKVLPILHGSLCMLIPLYHFATEAESWNYAHLLIPKRSF
jgi:hypothetical protein